MPLDYDKIMPIVSSVAASVSSKFPSYVLAEDTKGQLLLWIYRNRAQVERAVDDGSGWEAKITSTLRKVAFDHCNSEKAAVEGYDPSDIYRYSIPKIKTLIADAMDYENWQSFSSANDKVGGRVQPQSYGDRVAELIDVKAAMERVNQETYDLLVYQHKYNYTAEELAGAFNIGVDAAKKRSQRALKALQKELGYKETPTRSQPQRRSVRTNAAARAELANLYEG